jgi:PKD repeat protein
MKKLVKNQFAFLIMLIFVMLYSSININIHAQVLLGSSVNAFTQVGSNRTRVSYAPGINTVLFIHRGDPAIAGSSGNKAMYDISTNGGLSWANNVGSVIDLSSSAPHVRYPQGYIMNPANNTNLTNARIVAAAPKATGVNNSWGRITSGMVTLSATGKKESLVSDSAWIPNSFVERIPGEYWMVSDTNTDGKITLYKGVYSLAGDSVKWTVALKLAKSRMLFDRTIDGNVHYVNPMIAFSPNGQIGWIATNGEIAGGVVDSTLYPIFWSTTNGGQTWTGPQVVRLKNLSNVVASVNSTKPTATIDNDLVVDKNGNPHFAFVVAPKINAYSYNNPTTNKYPIFDITKVNNLWTAVRIDTVSSLNGASFGTLTHGNEIQLSRTKDGSIIFYCWTDTEVANQTTLGKNDYPDLFIKGYNIDATSFGPKISRIHGNHTIFLPNIADIVSDLDSSGYKMHAVITSPTGDENVTVNFSYLDNLYYPRLALINTINQNQSLCYGNQPNRIDGTTKFNINSTYRWIQLNSTSGGFSNAPGVNNLQNYQPGNLYTTTSFRRIVEMGSSADTSNNVIISVSSKTNPKFTVFEPNQCLFNNQFTFVDSTTRIGGGTVNYSWDFGDGSGSNLQNPTKIYNLSGTYVVRLSTYVSQTCKDTFTKTLNVYSKQNTIIDVNDSLQFLGNNSFVFNDNSQIQNGTIVYREWDFGNGTSSLSQNPSKSYSQHGRYKVKLKTTSDKGCVDSNQIFITVLSKPYSMFKR